MIIDRLLLWALWGTTAIVMFYLLMQVMKI